MLWFSLLCIVLGAAGSAANAQATAQHPHHVILFPGLSDDGTKGADLVGFALNLLNPGSQATIVVTHDQVVVHNCLDRTVNGWKVQTPGQAEKLLSGLRKSGVHNVIVNIDMDIGFLNFPARARSESNWAASQGELWTSALRSVFEGSTIGFASHSYGNDPAGECILKGVHVDYALMATPGAMRDTLNRIGKLTELLVLTAKGDFHGPTEFDGPVNFSHIRLINAPNPHNAIVTKGILEDPHLQFQTNLPSQAVGSAAANLIQGFASAHTRAPAETAGPGGVKIAPELAAEKKNLKDEKNKILKSRPGKDSTTWPVKKPPQDKKR